MKAKKRSLQQIPFYSLGKLGFISILFPLQGFSQSPKSCDEVLVEPEIHTGTNSVALPNVSQISSPSQNDLSGIPSPQTLFPSPPVSSSSVSSSPVYPGSSLPVYRGLDGVLVDTTRISNISKTGSSLIIRGFDLKSLIEGNASFLEFVHILLKDQFPNEQELEALRHLEKEHRRLPYKTSAVLRNFIHNFPDASPTDVLEMAVLSLGTEDINRGNQTPETLIESTISLLAKIPTVLAEHFRLSVGESAIEAQKSLSFEENFFYMMFGKIPDEKWSQTFKNVLIVYAEHGFNASTYTNRIVASTESDSYSAILAGIAALRGRLHGGALEKVMGMLEEIGEVSRVQSWVDEKRKNGEKIMGFGHRVYKNGDPRFHIFIDAMEKMARTEEQKKTLAIMKELTRVMEENKGLYPNVDFAGAPLLHWMGFRNDTLVSIFAMARVIGWSAHYAEQVFRSKRLIRPGAVYEGNTNLSVSEERRKQQNPLTSLE